MFGEKGVILTSGLADNVKATLAIWERDDGTEDVRCKVTVRRTNRSGRFNTNQPYKVWMHVRETWAVLSVLQRALTLMEEYYDGTLDLKDILAEDEDARLFTTTKSTVYPTIDGMFDLSEHLEKEEKEGTYAKRTSRFRRPSDDLDEPEESTDPNDHLF